VGTDNDEGQRPDTFVTDNAVKVQNNGLERYCISAFVWEQTAWNIAATSNVFKQVVRGILGQYLQ
jgi:hypothetical protein